MYRALRNWLTALALAASAPAFAGQIIDLQSEDGGRFAMPGNADGVYVSKQPNPSAHNPNLGALETGNGGTPYFVTNAVSGTSYQVTTGPSRLVRYEIGGSTTATVTFYDDADGTCSSNQRTPTRTSPSAAAPGIYEVGMDFSFGVCMLIGGASDAELGVVTLP